MYQAFLSVLVAALVCLTGVNAAQETTSNSSVAVYWGFGKTRPLAAYCQPGQGIDILIIGSISSLKTGGYLTGIFGPNCTVETDGSFNKGCSAVAQDIQTCQAANVKIFVGYSSDGNKWAIPGTQGASKIASQLWDSYGGNTSDSKIRPFGNVKVDGFDFDVESNPSHQAQNYLGPLINDLRGHFSSDTSKSYYISGAPQCPIPAPDMSNSIAQAQYDYLWIQFYNNDCAAADVVKNSTGNPNGAGQYNIKKWPQYVSSGKSKDAKLYVGLPASRSGAAHWDWVPPADLPKIITVSPGISGVMLWNTFHSDQATSNGCTYAQNVARVLSTGKPC